MNEFEKRIEEVTGDGLLTSDMSTLQINVGFRCNQRCQHCHLECGPHRTEEMAWPTMERIIEAADAMKPELVDITGGSPEINPHFKRFVSTLRKRGHTVQVRTNLTVMREPGMEDVPAFLREHVVHLVGSMPCYLEQNVCAQRGPGVYERSVDIIRRLNELGYGVEDELPLNLVYNPGGAFLPPPQATLEEAYRKELGDHFGIRFTHLLTIANMPLGRFSRELKKQHKDKEYEKLLKDSFNPRTVDGLMCRHQVSVGWDGTLYDCDFNLAIGLAVDHGAPDHIEDFDVAKLTTRRIVTGNHCFGCTAGSGSSCRGALAEGE
jgi:radical SAM/Cys-rich protein